MFDGDGQPEGLKLADVDMNFWYAIFGPKGMPDAVKAKISKAVERVMSDPKVRERLAKLDIEPSYAPGVRHLCKTRIALACANRLTFRPVLLSLPPDKNATNVSHDYLASIQRT